MSKTNKTTLIGISAFMILWILSIFFYRKYYLMKSNYTFAVFVGTEGSAWGRKRIINFKAHDNTTIKAEVNFDHRLKTGDTVWIKYSKQKPEIAEVIDINYKKYYKK